MKSRQHKTTLNETEQQDLIAFGRRVREARRIFGIKQPELYEIVYQRSPMRENEGRNRISELEKGKNNCDIMRFKRLCIALNVNPAYLLGLSDEPEMRPVNRYLSQLYHGVTQHFAESIQSLVDMVAHQAVDYMNQLPPSNYLALLGAVKEYCLSRIAQGDTDPQLSNIMNLVRQIEVAQARKQIEDLKYLDDIQEEYGVEFVKQRLQQVEKQNTGRTPINYQLGLELGLDSEND